MKMLTLPSSQKHMARSLRCISTHHRKSSFAGSFNFLKSSANIAVL